MSDEIFVLPEWGAVCHEPLALGSSVPCRPLDKPTWFKARWGESTGFIMRESRRAVRLLQRVCLAGMLCSRAETRRWISPYIPGISGVNGHRNYRSDRAHRPASAQRRPPPRWGLGIEAAGVTGAVLDAGSSGSVGVIPRLSWTPGLAVEFFRSGFVSGRPGH